MKVDLFWHKLQSKVNLILEDLDMTENSYYGQEGHGPYELIDIGTLELEEGGLISNCQLAVVTHGKLNAKKDNAILVTTWYSGTSKIMEDVYIGSGRALDPDKYFIVIVNQIGNGLSTSPHNSDGASFPKVRIGDEALRLLSAVQWAHSRRMNGRYVTLIWYNVLHRSPELQKIPSMIFYTLRLSSMQLPRIQNFITVIT